MDRQDTGSTGCDHALNLTRVEGMSRWIYVTKNRGNLLPLQGVSRGDERPGWYDDFALEFSRTDHNLKGDRSIAHGDTMLHSDKLANMGLEFLHEWPIIAEPPTIEQVLDTR
jgi:hypothetical protein